uniref:3-phosphoinositide-dependent protein kinase 2 n=1 Tax=Tanacetum cinerariifolium TaxID=118510 RepID=A0A6L2LKQ3_TANCI|nr:3-phosphoinositide-dependent protein kinase 2 [Tanacetum cinerariifolium]
MEMKMKTKTKKKIRYDVYDQPENLLLTSDGHIKIADFGSVKPMQDSRITVVPNASSGHKRIDDEGSWLHYIWQQKLVELKKLKKGNEKDGGFTSGRC